MQPMLELGERSMGLVVSRKRDVNLGTSPQSSVRGLEFWFDFGSIDGRTSVRSGKAMIEV